jgi:hypothetical protein
VTYKFDISTQYETVVSRDVKFYDDMRYCNLHGSPLVTKEREEVTIPKIDL